MTKDETEMMRILSEARTHRNEGWVVKDGVYMRLKTSLIELHVNESYEHRVALLCAALDY